MKTNKEVSDKLTEYFLTQDPEVVARILAANMIDLNRLYHFELLEDDERENLFRRLDHNIGQLEEFIKNGPMSDLKATHLKYTDD